ncbi:MAG: prepilin peptidase [Eubacteriales bacterium]|nr:prepilin peptidase [Eubacteriales bacterium]
MKFSVVGLILLRAIYTDFKEGKIENRWMIFGIITGLVFANIRDGPEGVWLSTKMMVITFFVLFILFVLKGLGAGDIKLFCVLATFYPENILWVIVCSFLAGGLIALGKMLVRFVRGKTMYIRQEKMNFSVPILIGSLIVILGM